MCRPLEKRNSCNQRNWRKSTFFRNHCVATNRKDIVIKSIANQTSSQEIKAEFDDVKMAVEALRESADTIPVKTKKGGERKDELHHLTSTVKDLKKTNVCASCWERQVNQKQVEFDYAEFRSPWQTTYWREKWANLPK